MVGCLPERTLRRLSDDLLDAYREEDAPSLPDRIVELASRHTRSEMTVCGHRLPDQQHRIRWYPRKLDLRTHDAAYEAFVHEHPVRNRFRATGQPGPHRLSDLVSLADFKQTGLYRDYFRHFGITRMVAVYVVTGPDSHVSLGVSRGGGDFSDVEMAVLAWLRPHLARAHLAAEEANRVQRWVSASEAALERARRGVVLLNPEGRVERAAPVARQWLRDIAGLEIVPGAALPAPLAGLLARSAMGRAWLSGPGGQLNVRQIPRPGGDLIVVEGPRAGGRSESFRAAGLTAREAEVLDWLCEGKTNAEIALITQAAPATVKKHLENIYAKLGVENRGAAARLAQDIAGD